MPDRPEILYWDSCAFLSYVNEHLERTPTLDALLERSSRGEVELYTSEISRVEVAFAASEQKRRKLSPEMEERIDSLWADSNAVVSVEYHGAIGQVARGLMREAITKGWSLKPLDAIHLATAQWLSSVGIKVDEFQTYDNLSRYASIVDFEICEPHTPQPRML